MRTPADNLTHAATARPCQWLVVALIASTFGLSTETHDKIVIQGIHGFANGESYLEETARYQDRFEYLGRVAGTFAVWRDRTDHLRFTLAYLEGYKPIPAVPGIGEQGRPRLVIVIEQGIISDVHTDIPNVQAFSIDKDTEGADKTQLYRGHWVDEQGVTMLSAMVDQENDAIDAFISGNGDDENFDADEHYEDGERIEH